MTTRSQVTERAGALPPPLPSNPLIVQSDRTLMLHTVRATVDESGRPMRDEDGNPATEEHPLFAEARDALSKFAELEKSPDYLHTYRITPVSVWNAAAIGISADDVEHTLHEFSCVPVPAPLMVEVRGWIERYGLLRIQRSDGGPREFELVGGEDGVLEEVLSHKTVASACEIDRSGETTRAFVDDLQRGEIKQRAAALRSRCVPTSRVPRPPSTRAERFSEVVASWSSRAGLARRSPAWP